MHANTTDTTATKNTHQPPKVQSPAVQRLIQEVRSKEGLHAVGGAYDRTHNRHNRGQ